MKNRGFKRLVEAVLTNKFEVELIESLDNTYYIKTTVPKADHFVEHYGEAILNFKTASLLFDLRVKDLNANDL